MCEQRCTCKLLQVQPTEASMTHITVARSRRAADAERLENDTNNVPICSASYAAVLVHSMSAGVLLLLKTAMAWSVEHCV
jgi:hypothetical protein